MKTIDTETVKQGLAPGNAFVLVEWCSILLQEIAGTAYWDKWGLTIIQSNARVLELCLGESTRSNMRQTALVITRRGLRKVFSNSDKMDKVIGDAVHTLSSKGPQPSAKNAVMLGVIAGVCARKAEAKKILSRITSEYYAFYIREIIGSRTQVPDHISKALEDFFVAFTTSEDVEKVLVPALEKALLRAPEIVLNDLVTPLFHSFSEEVDLSIVLRNNLLKPLLANTKSTNAVVRQGAFAAFKAAVLKSHDSDSIIQIAQEILVPLKSGKVPSAEQRAYYADMLTVLPPSKAAVTHVAPAMAVIAGKEANEAALQSETSTVLHYVTWGLLNDSEIDKQVIDAFAKGLSDKKVPVKKLWAIRLGELFMAIDSEELLKSKVSKLAESVMQPLMEIWQEVLTNPLAAAQSGLVTCAYILTAIARPKLALYSNAKVDSALKKAQVDLQALTMEPKPSFLLNQRIYGKLSSVDEFMWFIRALASTSQGLATMDSSSAVATAWSQAVIFCICSFSVKPDIRNFGSRTLSQLYTREPAHISAIIISGLWRWHYCVESGDKDSAASIAKTENQNLHMVVKSICLSTAEMAKLTSEIDFAVRRQQMISLLVLSRPELIPRVNWIELCLRIQVDPGELAKTSEDALIQQILDSTSFHESVRIL